MGNTDKTLQNKDYLNIYPITRERNVYDENNVNLKTKFENVVFKDNTVHKFAEELRDESSNILNPENCVTNYNPLTDIFEGSFSSGNHILRGLGINKKVTVSLILYSKPSVDTTFSIYDINDNTVGATSFVKIESFELNKVYTKTIDSISRITLWSSTPNQQYSFRLWINDGETGKPYGLYNPKRHITNSEAEFLKETFTNQDNILENQEFEIGSIDGSGNNVESDSIIRTKGFIEVTGDETIYFRGLDKVTFRYYDANKNFISGVLYWNQRDIKLVSFPSNAKYVRIIFAYTDNREISSTDELKDVYLGIKGELCYKLDQEQLFLNSEWEKSLNRLPFPYNEKSTTRNGLEFTVNDDGTVTVNGTATEATSFYLFNSTNVDVFDIEIGSKFTISGCPSGGGWASYSILNGYTSLSDFGEGAVGTYSKVNDLKEWMIRVAKGVTMNNVIFKPMITKGDKIPLISEYQQYNGKIIRKKDITPVLLWKNGNPNVAFEPTDITVSNLDKFSKIIVVYKQDNDPYGLPKENVFDVKYGCFGYLLGTKVDNIGTLVSRAFKITNSTTVRFGGGNLGNTTSNNECIPIAVYGSNY